MTDAEFLDNWEAAVSGDRNNLWPLLNGDLSRISTDALTEAKSLLADAVAEDGDPGSGLLPIMFFFEGYLRARREAAPRTLQAQVAGVSVSAYVAHEIQPESWLHRPTYAWFRAGYAYAQTQTTAIPALAKCSPEDLFSAVTAILRGVQRADLKVPEL